MNEWARLEAHAQAALELWFDGYDVMLTPVLSEPPPPLGRYAPQQRFETLFALAVQLDHARPEAHHRPRYSAGAAPGEP